MPLQAFGATPTLDFCPVTLGTEPGMMTDTLSEITDTAFVGAGAIGTGIILILSLMGTTGELTVVEPEVFEPLNVTTYSIGTQHDADERVYKTQLVRRYLPRVDVLPSPAPLRTSSTPSTTPPHLGSVPSSAPYTASRPVTKSSASTPTSPSTAARADPPEPPSPCMKASRGDPASAAATRNRPSSRGGAWINDCTKPRACRCSGLPAATNSSRTLTSQDCPPTTGPRCCPTSACPYAA